MFKRLYIIFLMLIFVGSLSAATGKLSGVVKDKQTGEALIGVNIILEGTLLGASTDEDGFYLILNIPPGHYTVVFDYIGYKEVRMENVRIVSDLTKRLDVAMEATALQASEPVVVVAEKPFFEATATNTVRVLDAEDIANTPIKGVNSIVAINAGVVVQDGSGGDTDNATINIRGGRGNETLVVVDGVPQNDVLFGNAAGTIPDAAIDQVSSQLGGFSAKYGSAQSGVVNITTKSGAARFFGSADFISSNITDAYNYNSFTGTLGGPLFTKKLSYFVSGEYLTTDDQRPRASGLIIPTANINVKARPNTEGSVFRFTGKLSSQFSKFKITLSANGSLRDGRGYVHTYAKNNSEHNPKVNEDNFGGSLRFSQIINPTTFWDVTLRAKQLKWQRGDGVWNEDLVAYGDSAKNAEIGVHLTADGQRVGADSVGVFFARGRVFNNFTKYKIRTGGIDFNFTKQFRNHLIELGGVYERHEVRYYTIFPRVLAIDKDSVAADIRYNNAIGRFYGYDIFGNEISDSRFRTVVDPTFGFEDRYQEAAPKRPTIAGAYIQDRIEFQDFTLNLGVRWDYFKADHFRFKDPENIYGFGPRPNRLDEEDLEPMPSENYLSPRVGFAFHLTERTVFHAQYGIFRQAPRFFDIYDSWKNLQTMEQRDGQGQRHGWLKMEKTTAYEFGFAQQLGNIASLDLTAYYKNVQGLVNENTIRTAFGQTTRTYIARVNQDFGTIKGLAFSFNLRRLHGVSTRIDYTISLSEGTGSDPSSSHNATFRNPDHEIPLAIAPLDFDQRHTLTISLDIRAGKNGGPDLFGTKLLASAGVNFLFTFNSGRPYTPVAIVNPLEGDQSLFGSSTTQYVNSAYADGITRLDLRLDKKFYLAGLTIAPYLWIQNLFDTENFVSVWRSTGEPDNTGFVDTPEGQQRKRIEESKGNLDNFLLDLKALERDPSNYGLPRIVRLGIQMKF